MNSEQIQELKPAPFEPSIGKVCLMRQVDDDGEYNRVFLGELNGKFIGC